MKLAHRLLLQSLAIVAVMVVSVVVIIDSQLHSSITQQAIQDLAGEARFLATQWKPGVDPDSLADQAGVATGHRITLIDSTGQVVGDSEFDGPALQGLENHSNRPEVVEARKSGIGSVRRMSPSTGEEQLYVAVKAPRGVARVSVTTKTVEELFARARSGVLVAGLISSCLPRFSPLFSRALSPGRLPTFEMLPARLPPVNGSGTPHSRHPARLAISRMQSTDWRNSSKRGYRP